MNIIKKSLVLGCAMVASMVIAADAEISLADASAKIGEVIDNPAMVGSVMQQLSKDDQTAYLARVNAAIGKLPGSAEERTAKFVEVNSEAVKAGRSKRNVPALMAEVFATVPPEALTVINERFAEDFLNRDSDPTVSDAAFATMASNLLTMISERNAGNANADVRNAFMALMLLRADGGKSEGLRDALISKLSPDVQALARNEWIPAAMGEGQSKSYDPMLDYAGVDSSSPAANPSVEVVSDLVGPQAAVALFADFGNESEDVAANIETLANMMQGGNTYDGREYSANPRTLNTQNPWHGDYRREPDGYMGQFGTGF